MDQGCLILMKLLPCNRRGKRSSGMFIRIVSVKVWNSLLLCPLLVTELWVLFHNSRSKIVLAYLGKGPCSRLSVHTLSLWISWCFPSTDSWITREYFLPPWPSIQSSSKSGYSWEPRENIKNSPSFSYFRERHTHTELMCHLKWSLKPLVLNSELNWSR